MECTTEYIESCGCTIAQPRRGHRYGAESLALARFAGVRDNDRVADLGSGVGIVAFMAAGVRTASIVAVEIQRALHDIARENVLRNNLGERILCVCDDWRSFAVANAERFDLVLSNPPFFPSGRGRMSPDPQRAAARHELHGTLKDLLMSADRLLAPKGRFAIAFNARRRMELEAAAFFVGLTFHRCETPSFGDASSSFLLAAFRKT
jgi:tRNA1Val (adenine37-N6)-methyltransferase